MAAAATPYPILPGTTAGQFVLRVLSACAIKLSASVDDVAWLLPFVAGPRRRTNLLCGLQYVLTVLVVASIASGIAVGGGAAIAAATDEGSNWPSERVLGLTSGIALALYSLVLFKGWMEERQEAQEEEATERASDALASIVSQARAAEEFFSASAANASAANAAPAGQDASDQQQQQEDDGGLLGWLQTTLGLTPQPPSRSGHGEATPAHVLTTVPQPSYRDNYSTPQRPQQQQLKGQALSSTATVDSSAGGTDDGDASTDAAGALVERCRALMRLREPLGAHYGSRKEKLLSELISLADLERSADALDELRKVGFLESEEELLLWADQLLSEERALAAGGSATTTPGSAQRRLVAPLDIEAINVAAGPGGAGEDGDGSGDDDDDAATSHRRLLIVSVLGMMDDVAIFIAMLLAGTFTWLELLIGVFFGASAVLCFCLFMTLFKPIVNLVQSIPLFLIIGSFAIYTLVEAILSQPGTSSASDEDGATNATMRRLLSIDDQSSWSSPPPPPPAPALVYLYALGLSISSSTDNFAVGASLGVAGLTLHTRFNLIIAAANSAGAYLAATGGQLIGHFAEGMGAWLAAAVFAHLAWQEGASIARGESASPLLTLAEQAAAAQLAIPMTLNNLAGGIAGGVLGIGPGLAGFAAFVASFVMMALGYLLGRCVGSALQGRLDVRLLSCAIFGFLCLSQVEDKLRAFWSRHVDLSTRQGAIEFAAMLTLLGLIMLAVSYICLARRRIATARRLKGDAELSILLERCRALMRLRASLGMQNYLHRKEGLLDELVAAVEVERGAAILGELWRLGFLESEEELAQWADQLLATEGAESRKALLSGLRAADGAAGKASSSHLHKKGTMASSGGAAGKGGAGGGGGGGGSAGRSPWPRARLFGGGASSGAEDGLI